MYRLVAKPAGPDGREDSLDCASSAQIFLAAQRLFARRPGAWSVQVDEDGAPLYEIARPREGEPLMILPL